MRYAGDIYDLELENGEVQFSDSAIQRNAEMDGLLKIISTVEGKYSYLLHLDPA